MLFPPATLLEVLEKPPDRLRSSVENHRILQAGALFPSPRNSKSARISEQSEERKGSLQWAEDHPLPSFFKPKPCSFPSCSEPTSPRGRRPPRVQTREHSEPQSPRRNSPLQGTGTALQAQSALALGRVSAAQSSPRRSSLAEASPDEIALEFLQEESFAERAVMRAEGSGQKTWGKRVVKIHVRPCFL